MAYEKQTWQTGDVVTAEKLNHLEGGVAAAGSMLIVHETYDENTSTYTLDKTWQEIYDALISGIAILFQADFNEEDKVEQSFFNTAYITDDSFVCDGNVQYSASTANGYPSRID